MMTQETEILCRIFNLGRSITSNDLAYNLTVIQLRTLGYIYKQKSARPTDIAKNFNITPASVTSQIDNLVEDGWLERVYNQEDKRVIEVVLTKTGKKNLPKAIQDLKNRFSWISGALNESEETEFLQLLKKITSSQKK